MKHIFFIYCLIILVVITTSVKLKTSTKLKETLKSGIEALLQLKTRQDIFGKDTSEGSLNPRLRNEVESLIKRNEEALVTQ